MDDKTRFHHQHVDLDFNRRGLVWIIVFDDEYGRVRTQGKARCIQIHLEVEAAVAVPRTAVSAAAPVPHDDGRHVTRDYSYVRAEIWRIAAVGGFITISLILTAIFLR